jgi:hypothetical protein
MTEPENTNVVFLAHVQQQLATLNMYMLTIQTCNRCGHCFQNRNHIYRGRRVYCRPCRNKIRKAKTAQQEQLHQAPYTMQISSDNLDNTINCDKKMYNQYKTYHKVTCHHKYMSPVPGLTEVYWIERAELSLEMWQSLKALHSTVNISDKEDPAFGIRRRIHFENELGRDIYEGWAWDKHRTPPAENVNVIETEYTIQYV